jgi:hypothetical protein
MRATLAQCTNEFVSLAVMALMAIALVAGQAGAAQATAEEPAAEVIEQVLVVDIDFRIRREGE